MITHEHRHVVGRGIPAGLIGHLVVDDLPVDLQSLEGDVANVVVGIVAVDDRNVRYGARIADVAEGNILHAFARCRTPFLVVARLHVKEAAILYLLNADIVEEHVADDVAVAAVDGQTALVVHLRLGLPQDIDILIDQMFDSVTHLWVAVYADVDGVRHIGP